MLVSFYSRQVLLPELSDLGSNYNPFRGMIPRYSDVFDFLTSVESVTAVLSITDMKLNLPGISGVAYDLHSRFFAKCSSADEWNEVKKFAGAIIRIIHEINGYRITGNKGDTIFKDFGNGEIYSR